MKKLMAVILMLAACLTGCAPSNTASDKKITVSAMPTSTAIPEVKYTALQELYLKLNESMSYDDVLTLVKATDFVYNEIGGNSSMTMYIGWEEDELKMYHAEPGQRIEINYPIIRRVSGSAAMPYLQYFIYSHDGKRRHYELIQLFEISGYNISIGYGADAITDPGVYVREWPARDGRHEYTKFETTEEAMRYITLNKNE